MDSTRGPLKPGDRFHKWEIIELLGKGGHAFVYAAHEPFLSRDVALKIIPSSRETGRRLDERARAEARVLSRIDHPNVVRTFEAAATEDGTVYLAMEQLVGRDLRKALNERRRLSPAEMLIIALQAAEGVAAAHKVGAIHRDLKPENVFICAQNAVKILDFGVAKVMGYGAATTQKDMLHGTLLYMSPEQLRGFGVSERSDIFSLGTLLYESMYCHPALLGKEIPTAHEVGWIQIERLPPLLDRVDPSIPPYVARFVQRAILKNAGQRYQSMEEVATVAKKALQRLYSEASAEGMSVPCVDLSIAARDERRGELATNSSERDANGERRPSSSPSAHDTDVQLLPLFSTGEHGSGNSPAHARAVSSRSATGFIALSDEPDDAKTRAAPVARTVQNESGSASQLTPPPTTSQASSELSFSRETTRVLATRRVAIFASGVGLLAGIAYALAVPPSNEARRAWAAPSSSALANPIPMASTQAARSPMDPVPASSAAVREPFLEDETAARAPAIAKGSQPPSTPSKIVAAKPSRPRRTTPAPDPFATPPFSRLFPPEEDEPPARTSTPSRPAPRSKMDERLERLERDLAAPHPTEEKKTKSSATASSLPASGLGAH